MLCEFCSDKEQASTEFLAYQFVCDMFGQRDRIIARERIGRIS
jgi:hypothetical protein